MDFIWQSDARVPLEKVTEIDELPKTYLDWLSERRKYDVVKGVKLLKEGKSFWLSGNEHPQSNDSYVIGHVLDEVFKPLVFRVRSGKMDDAVYEYTEGRKQPFKKVASSFRELVFRKRDRDKEFQEFGERTELANSLVRGIEHKNEAKYPAIVTASKHTLPILKELEPSLDPERLAGEILALAAAIEKGGSESDVVGRLMPRWKVLFSEQDLDDLERLLSSSLSAAK